LRAGVHPSLLPGGRRLANAAERAEVEAEWGTLAAEPGRSTREILDACARRELDVLFLLGVDPLRDFPDAALARRALENVRYKVVQGLELGDLEPYADAFLPSSAWAERDGSATDWEGRSQRVRPVRGPAGVSRPDWEILAGLAAAMGGDLGFESLDELREESSRLLAPRDAVVRTDAWTGTGPPQLLGELTLCSYPLLVDDGRLTNGADELRSALGEAAFAELNPEDAEKRGVLDGGRVRVRTEVGEAELPVRVTPDVALGTVFVPFNQPGLAANALLSGGFVEPARVEAVAPAEEGAA
jgi:NADH-quinone oxidoreductase subunit G